MGLSSAANDVVEISRSEPGEDWCQSRDLCVHDDAAETSNPAGDQRNSNLRFTDALTITRSMDVPKHAREPDEGCH